MDKRSRMMLRVLLNRYAPKISGALLKFLPEEEAKAVMSQEIQSNDLAPIIKQPLQSLSKIHYSWIQPLLEKFPPPLQPSVASVLSAQQVAGLEPAVNITVSDVVRAFLLTQIYEQLEIGGRLPVEYLPESELNSLANWNKAKLVTLGDFLGIHDLASEVRHIVNPNHLKNIYTCLTPKQFYFLKLCLHQKEQLTTPKLGIDPTKQDCPHLKNIIHRRGLLRLGKALSGQHPDLIWHVAHTLDVNRGNIILKEYQPNESPKVTNILRHQVLYLMNFLETS